MKYLLSNCMIALLLMQVLTAAAQAPVEEEKVLRVGTVNISEMTDIHYIQILGVKQNGVLNVEVDYGKKLAAGKNLISGAGNQPQSFDSMVAVLNYLNERGWEFINAYEVKSLEGPAYSFILQRKRAQTSTDLVRDKATSGG